MEVARIYRNYKPKIGEYKFNITIKESDLFFVTDKDVKEKAYFSLLKYRKIIEEHIKEYPEFFSSLRPLKIPEKPLSKIILSMYKASEKANVGPFSAVAGAISQFVALDLKKYCKEILIENGGDIFIYGNKDRIVALKGVNNLNLGIKIKKEKLPLAVCSSSSKIGHSLSFGNADLVTVIAKDGALADAFATSICNKIKKKANLIKILEEVSLDEIIGIIVIYNNKIAIKGDIEFTKLI